MESEDSTPPENPKTEKQSESSSKRQTKKAVTRKFMRLALFLVGIACIGAGLYGLNRRHTATTGEAILPDPSQVVDGTDQQPEEKKPTDDQAASYTVPADQPRSIRIDSVNIYGLVQRVGVTKDNAVGTPSNVNFAGWYANSQLPGADDLSIIDGHVSGKYSDGIFKHLSDVKNGDTVEVEFGDKSTKQFTVVDVKKLPEAESAAFLFEKRPDIVSQLNLITCGGAFNKDTQEYEDRVIVVTQLI